MFTDLEIERAQTVAERLRVASNECFDDGSFSKSEDYMKQAVRLDNAINYYVSNSFNQEDLLVIALSLIVRSEKDLGSKFYKAQIPYL